MTSPCLQSGNVLRLTMTFGRSVFRQMDRSSGVAGPHATHLQLPPSPGAQPFLTPWREFRAGCRRIGGAHGDGEKLGRPAHDRGDARGVVGATSAAPQTMRQHCDHPEGDFPLSWNERHGALGLGRSLLVEARGLALFAAAEEFPRGGGKLRASTVM